MFESGVEQWKLQCVNDTSDGINDPTGQEPVECSRCQGSDDGLDGCEADPAHGDINHGRNPFGAINPDGIEDYTDDCDEPDEGQESEADRIAQDDQAYRSVGSCDQNENHHVIDLFKHLIDMVGDIQGMINGAGSVEQDHADDEDGNGDRSKST